MISSSTSSRSSSSSSSSSSSGSSRSSSGSWCYGLMQCAPQRRSLPDEIRPGRARARLTVEVGSRAWFSSGVFQVGSIPSEHKQQHIMNVFELSCDSWGPFHQKERRVCWAAAEMRARGDLHVQGLWNQTPMNTHIYICMYVYVYIYIYMYTYIYIYTYTHICMCMCMYTQYIHISL